MSHSISYLCLAITSTPPDYTALVPLLDALEEARDPRWVHLVKLVGGVLDALPYAISQESAVDATNFLVSATRQGLRKIRTPIERNMSRGLANLSFTSDFRRLFWAELEDGGAAGAVNRLAEALAMEDELESSLPTNTAMRFDPVTILDMDKGSEFVPPPDE